MDDRERIIAYVLKNLGKASTFRLSRILLMLDLEWEEKHGEMRTGLHYGLFPPAFYVEEFPDLLLNMEGVEKVMEKDESGMEKGFFIFHGEMPELDEETRRALSDILERAAKMDDHELNMAVVKSEGYLRKLEK